ncbi:MAG: hypothetical protein RQ723_13460, partial [Desulfuromonadales bacterium]|nr:hypothetical protein [Desulfuromonadales bacterium]
RGVMDKWTASGQTKAGFCRNNDISVWRFHYWFARLRELDGEAGFARIDTESSSGVQLRLPTGLVLELSDNFSEDVLSRFLRVAGRSC